MKNKIFSNNKGLTLVEMLAALTLVSIIGVLAYSILFNGIKTHERVMIETDLRDEADIIMSNFIGPFFSLKTTDILSLKDNQYLKTVNGDIGFKNGNVVVYDEIITLTNSNIRLSKKQDKKSYIKRTSDTEFEVLLVLESTETDQTLELVSRFHVIDDREVENSDE